MQLAHFQLISHDLVVSVKIEFAAISVAWEKCKAHKGEHNKAYDVDFIFLAVFYKLWEGQRLVDNFLTENYALTLLRLVRLVHEVQHHLLVEKNLGIRLWLQSIMGRKNLPLSRWLLRDISEDDIPMVFGLVELSLWILVESMDLRHYPWKQ